MAQGGLKKRSDKFAVAKSKSSRKNKPLGPKKGAHYIAPKKAKKVKAQKLKKQLQKQIGQRIEQEITQTASKGGTEFRVLSVPTPSTSSEAGAQGKAKGKAKGKQ